MVCRIIHTNLAVSPEFILQPQPIRFQNTGTASGSSQDRPSSLLQHACGLPGNLTCIVNFCPSNRVVYDVVDGLPREGRFVNLRAIADRSALPPGAPVL